MAKYNVAGFVDMVVEMQRPLGLAEQLEEGALAVLKRGTTQIVSAQLQQIERE